MMREKRKVLIVDDDEGAREFVEAIMESEGWDTVTGKTGRDAVDLAQEAEPDLIIMDVMMPEMNGFEAFKLIRGDFMTKDIPIIMLTAVNEEMPGAQHDEASMEEDLGVARPEGFVDKPVDAKFLMNTIFGVVG